ncbi:MAG TPA: hypothetical protein VE596_09975 [Gaiellaceae bacterium]|nr:hypothetical protein [Gaiellaceae bacterium]
MHTGATAFAIEKLAQQVVLGGRPGLDDARPPGAHLLDAVEQLLGDDRLVQAADRAVPAVQAAHVAAVGGVEEDVADAVLAERAALCAADALCVQQGGERAVGFLPGGVALEQLAH